MCAQQVAVVITDEDDDDDDNAGDDVDDEVDNDEEDGKQVNKQTNKQTTMPRMPNRADRQSVNRAKRAGDSLQMSTKKQQRLSSGRASKRGLIPATADGRLRREKTTVRSVLGDHSRQQNSSHNSAEAYCASEGEQQQQQSRAEN